MKTTQTLIILLLAANLAATVFFGIQNKPGTGGNPADQTARHALPSMITPEVRNNLFDQFITAFNSRDVDAMYNMLGPIAKAQVTKETADKEFKKLIKFFHSVTGGAYTYSELTSTHGSTTVYTLYYAVKFSEKSEIGRSGMLKITIAVQGQTFQVYGLFLDGDTRNR